MIELTLREVNMRGGGGGECRPGGEVSSTEALSPCFVLFSHSSLSVFLLPAL